MGSRTFTKKEEQKVVVPLARHLCEIHQGKPMVIGIQGGQGTGKSTIAKILEKHLKQKGHKVHHFSLDDFYKTARSRELLRKKYPKNEFYQIVRGMPGTHYTTKMKQTFSKIKKGKPFEIPIFDKSKNNGEGEPLKKKIKIKTKQDFVLFEGWCVGVPYVTSPEFVKICKKYKIPLKNVDPTLKDHKIILRYLKEYQPVWELIDYTVQIMPPNANTHTRWRLQAEQRMKKKTGEGMSDKQVKHFVNVFLPLTYVSYDKIKPDCLMRVDKNHNFYDVKF